MNVTQMMINELPFGMAEKLRLERRKEFIRKNPITSQYVAHLIHLVREEKRRAGTLQAELRPDMTALNALLANGESGLSRYAKRSKKRRGKKK